MRRYESVVIFDPDLPDDDIVSLTERFGNVIKNNGGEIIKIEDWGSKRLAYLVRKKDKGRYILFDFVGLPAAMREVERQFKITEEVMKFLSVKLDEEVDLEAFKANAAQQEAAAAEAAAARAAKQAAAAEAEKETAEASEVAESAPQPEETTGTPATEPPSSQPEAAVGGESSSEAPQPEPAQGSAEAPAPKEQAASPEKQNEEV